VVSAVRGQSLQSRLIDELGLVSEVDFDIDWNDLGSTLTISAELNRGVPFDAVERVIEQHLASLGQRLLSSRELARLRALCTTQLLSNFEDVFERAQLHLASLRHFDRPFSLAEAIARIGAIDARTVALVGRRYLDPNHRLSARFDEAKVWVPAGGRVSYDLERLP
jgi:predicted Zn-dependent peptidase